MNSVPDGEKVEVKLIPRIDPQEFAQLESSSKKRPKGGQASRPKARLFNVVEMVSGLESIRNEYIETRGYRFDQQGYLLKTINLRSLKHQDVTPTLDELQAFHQKMEEGSEEDENSEERDEEERERRKKAREERRRLKAQSTVSMIDLQSIKERKVVFVKGDTVVVVKGDYVGTKGKVESVSGEVVTVNCFEQYEGQLRFLSEELERSFKPGDHVKVLAGKHEGETGLITKVEDKLVHLLSDSNKLHQITVLKQDVQETTEVATGRLKLGMYELHDLVKLPGTRNVGVIIRIESDSFRILENTGSLKTVRLPEMGLRLRLRDATSFDKHSNSIAANDLLRIEEGKYKGRTGKVVHIYRFFAFLQSSEILDNYGWLAIKTDQCSLVGGPSTHRSMGYASLANPTSSPSSFSPSANLKSPASTKGGKGYQGRKDPLLQKTVTIVKGKHKGKIGIVTQCTDSKVQVELHSVCMTVTIGKDEVKELDQYGSSSSRPSSAFDGGMTPRALQTPVRQTPTHSSVWDPHHPSTPSRTDTPGSAFDQHEWTPESVDMLHTPGFHPYSPLQPLSPASVDSVKSNYAPATPAAGFSDVTPSFDPTTPSSAGGLLPFFHFTPKLSIPLVSFRNLAF